MGASCVAHRPHLGLHSMLNIRTFPIKIWISNSSLKIRKDGKSGHVFSSGNTSLELKSGHPFREARTLQTTTLATTPDCLTAGQFYPLDFPVLHPNTFVLNALV